MIDGYNIQTPTLLFPAISLLLLAYTNRFLGITSVIRNLHHDLSSATKDKDFYLEQINVLSERIDYIIKAQKMGVLSLLFCIVSMISLIVSHHVSFVMFIAALLAMFLSLFYAYVELDKSKSALKYILDDCRNIK